jgi:hypothetical protein
VLTSVAEKFDVQVMFWTCATERAWFESQSGHWLSCLRFLCGCPQSLKVNVVIVPRLGNYRFLADAFELSLNIPCHAVHS